MIEVFVRSNSKRISTGVFLLLLSGGCGDYNRDNPFDPVVTGGLSLHEQLLGSWNRVEEQGNELYIFKSDGGVELRRFFSPDGGPVDRNASYPTTLVRVFEGIYKVVNDKLTISFTHVYSNNPDDGIGVPAIDKVVEISIRRNTLTLDEPDGRRFYNRYKE